ncbi:MAG TPA: T9SS type A sorting domain-containing protein, partial [Hymenobacter sp.]|uniref:T9SS type A sorting domain-containing protein n=1 Tax=Hymenobacter sp. TaxID=1898978 RepID=UPI002D7F1BC0
ALNVAWTYRHPPQATPALAPRQVYELADGTLAWLAADGVSTTLGGQPTPYLYLIRVGAAGQPLGQQRVSSAACGGLVPYSWLPLPGGSALVAGAARTCAAAPGAFPAYLARLDQATLLAAPVGAASNVAAQLFPNPATAEAIWQGAVPGGTGTAELVLTDVLGRVVRRVPVAGRGAQVAQALELRGLAAGTYACRLLVAGQPVGGVQKLTYLP